MYALAVAVVAPVMLFARMQLRYLLASRPEAEFAVYLRGRLIASGGCLILLSGAASGLTSADQAGIIALVAASRFLEDLGDLSYGVRQRQDRWSRIAGSQLLRGLGGSAAVIGTTALGGSLAAGLGANVAWQLFVTLRVDAVDMEWPAGSWLRALGCLRTCWPLGVAATLVSVNGNLPRYALELYGDSAAVGQFAALMQLGLLGNLPVQGLAVASLADVGRRAREGRGRVQRLLGAQALVSLLIGLAGLAVAFVWGQPLLLLLYTPEIAALAPLLPWAVAGAIFIFLSAVFGYGLVALGGKNTQVVVFGLSALTGAAACRAFIPDYGLEGAVMANLVGWSSAAILSGAALYERTLRISPETEVCPPERESSKLNACSTPVGSSSPSPS